MAEANVVRIQAVLPPPGRMVTVKVGSVKVAIANVGGRLRAFDDECTHEGCSLSRGRLAGPTVACPCHGSRFDLRTGEVLDPPAEDPLRIRSITQDGDDVLIEA